MSDLLMQVQSSKILSADLLPSILYLYDDKLIFNANIGVFSDQKYELDYEQISAVNQYRGILESKLEIINSGGRGNIIMEHIPNDKADQAQELIEQRSKQAKVNVSSISSADELTKLADLRDRGAITDEEYQSQKAKILGEG